MSIAEMQACLARLYVDDPFRKLFFLDQAAACEGYRLTETERNALDGLDSKTVNFFAGSLKRKREGKFRGSYPLLYKLDPAEIRRYYDRYYQLFPTRPNLPYREDILQFGRFMEETLATAEELPTYASDVAKYERLVNTVSLSPVTKPDSNVPEANDDQPDDLFDILLARPRLDSNTLIETFTYDITAIEDALAAERVPNDLEPGEYYIIFQRVSDTFEPKIFQINFASKKLLDLCSGQRSVLKIVSVLEHIFRTKDARQDVIDIINQFRSMNVIRM
ncbi:MAG: hypothetical protein KDJ65_29620 [Anaerolineae bacterium]|nr:hypothetical protein [Anaerolineae bacterium]